MNWADLVRGGLPVDRQVALAQLLGHPGPDHVHPEDPARPGRRPVFSATTFTSPSVSPMIRARLFPPKGSFFTTTSSPARRAWASVSPTKATSGWQ